MQGMSFLAAEAILQRPHRLMFSFSLSFCVSIGSACGSAERIDDATAAAFENGASTGTVL